MRSLKQTQKGITSYIYNSHQLMMIRTDALIRRNIAEYLWIHRISEPHISSVPTLRWSPYYILPNVHASRTWLGD